MTDTTGLTIFGFACTILGAAIGIVGTYFVAVRLARDHTKILAGMRLRDAFAPEVVKIQHLDEKTSHEAPRILEAAFEKHHMAANQFGFFLRNDESKSFIQAWRKYCTSNNEDKPDFDQYIVLPEEVVDRIYAILEFTRH